MFHLYIYFAGLEHFGNIYLGTVIVSGLYLSCRIGTLWEEICRKCDVP